MPRTNLKNNIFLLFNFEKKNICRHAVFRINAFHNNCNHCTTVFGERTVRNSKQKNGSTNYSFVQLFRPVSADINIPHGHTKNGFKLKLCRTSVERNKHDESTFCQFILSNSTLRYYYSVQFFGTNSTVVCTSRCPSSLVVLRPGEYRHNSLRR